MMIVWFRKIAAGSAARVFLVLRNLVEVCRAHVYGAGAGNDPNRRCAATFDLDGLFDTPIQPNLARCGR